MKAKHKKEINYVGGGAKKKKKRDTPQNKKEKTPSIQPLIHTHTP